MVTLIFHFHEQLKLNNTLKVNSYWSRWLKNKFNLAIPASIKIHKQFFWSAPPSLTLKLNLMLQRAEVKRVFALFCEITTGARF